MVGAPTIVDAILDRIIHIVHTMSYMMEVCENYGLISNREY